MWMSGWLVGWCVLRYAGRHWFDLGLSASERFLLKEDVFMLLHDINGIERYQYFFLELPDVEIAITFNIR